MAKARATKTTDVVASSPKVQKSGVKPKAKENHHPHPPYAEMVKKAISELKERKGSSRAAILKFITKNYGFGEGGMDRTNKQLHKALKAGLENGSLKHTTGTGMAVNGKFRLGDKKSAASAQTEKEEASKKSTASKSPVGSKKTIASKAPSKSTKKPATPISKAASKSAKSPASAKKSTNGKVTEASATTSSTKKATSKTVKATKASRK